MEHAFGLLKDNNEFISKSYEKLGNYKLSLEYFKLFKNYHDSIFNDNSQRVMEEMQTRFDTEKKEQEISKLIFNRNLTNKN